MQWWDEFRKADSFIMAFEALCERIAGCAGLFGEQDRRHTVR